MGLQEKLLGQNRPANTNATSIYSPGDNTTAIIKNIVVCNNSTTNRTFRIFCHSSGTNYSRDTALYYDVSINANTTSLLSTFVAMNDTNGNLAVQSSAGDDITFTVFGTEIT